MMSIRRWRHGLFPLTAHNGRDVDCPGREINDAHRFWVSRCVSLHHIGPCARARQHDRLRFSRLRGRYQSQAATLSPVSYKCVLSGSGNYSPTRPRRSAAIADLRAQAEITRGDIKASGSNRPGDQA
jgi:hypothetical protein